MRVPDARLWYTAPDARDFLDQVGPDGRLLYAVTLLTLDLVMPVLYAGLLGCLIARVCPEDIGRRLVWVPVGTAAADIGENILLAYAAGTYDGETLAVTWAATCLTGGKWALAATAILVLIVGALWRVLNTRRVR